MKKRKIIFITCLTMFCTIRSYSQFDTVRIKTSAVCSMCKERIENDLSFEKGVKSGILDLKLKVVTVVYNPGKTDEQKIRTAITKMGYDADTLKAVEKAYRRLPDCCRHENKMH